MTNRKRKLPKKGKVPRGEIVMRSVAGAPDHESPGLPRKGGVRFSLPGAQKFVDSLPPGFWVSMRQFCEETGRDRGTLSRRLRDTPVATRQGTGGYPLYRLRDLIALIYARDARALREPERFEPHRRKAHYSAELKKMQLAQDAEDLVPRAEVEEERGRSAALVAHFLDTLPAILARDCALPSMVLEKVKERVERVRATLSNNSLITTPPPSRQPSNPLPVPPNDDDDNDNDDDDNDADDDDESRLLPSVINDEKEKYPSC